MLNRHFPVFPDILETIPQLFAEAIPQGDEMVPVAITKEAH